MLMYSYSPIKQMVVRNFRNIGDVTVSFDESPIVSLIGENESGKTSIVKAFSVCAINSDYRSQKDFIRDGTTGFGVMIELQDGTQITRIKMTNGNRYTVKMPDGSIWDAQKIEPDVPAAVSKVMGLIEEPETGEYLHIRTYEDKLLFVVTPASTNYKVMYNALKISQITSAIREGAAEANALKASISDSDTSVNTLMQSMAAIKSYDIEPLVNIKETLAKEKGIIAKLDRIVETINTVRGLEASLGAIQKIDEAGLKPIDIGECTRLNDIGRVLDDIKRSEEAASAYSEISKAEFIDTSTLDKIESVVSRMHELSEMERKSNTLIELDNLDTVSETELMKLCRCTDIIAAIELAERKLDVYSDLPEPVVAEEINSIQKADQAIELMAAIHNDEATLAGYVEYTDNVIEWMKSIGVATTSCPKCGESIIIDTSVL